MLPAFGFNRAWPFSVMPRLLFPHSYCFFVLFSHIAPSYCVWVMSFLLIINRAAQAKVRRNHHRDLFFRYGMLRRFLHLSGYLIQRQAVAFN